ncbi:MAG: hypothetical protein EOO02_01310 [Chitinophagaceae bacterium]|nr:MAG: hypothetical protein EOO02_01310 [Chitinophagaceae bacterium]
MIYRSAVALLISICFATFSAQAQRIYYSDPEREDSRRTNFDIIGKIGNNTLIFKNNRSANEISVYDAEMKRIDRVNLNKSSKWVNVDFIPYQDFAWMIYQYQDKNILYCMGTKINSQGKMMIDPIELDTTKIGWSADNKIYSTIFSDDKKQIMVFKINSKNPKNFLFTTLLFDDSMNLKGKQQLNMEMEERNDYFTDFLVDNDGDMVFGKYTRKGNSDFITDLKLIVKKVNSESFQTLDLRTGDKILDEIKLKVDNTNRRYLFSGFFYKQRRGNIEGLYSVVWDKAGGGIRKETLISFSDDLRRNAKGPDANVRLAFNDYFIKNITIRKDGGYLMVSESMYTSTRGNAFNRWDYMGWNNPWMGGGMGGYYSPFYSPYGFGSPWNRYGYGGNQSNRYHAENIMVISFDKDGGVEWTNIIPKTQYDDESDALISNTIMNTGGELHFLFNQYERRTLLLNDQSISPDGKVTRHPTLKNLERGVEFMPRYGKQISARSMIIPTQYRNYLTFARLDF